MIDGAASNIEVLRTTSHCVYTHIKAPTSSFICFLSLKAYTTVKLRSVRRLIANDEFLMTLYYIVLILNITLNMTIIFCE